MRLTPRQVDALSILHIVRNLDVYGYGKGWLMNVTTFQKFRVAEDKLSVSVMTNVVDLRVLVRHGLAEKNSSGPEPVWKITEAGISRLRDPAAFLTSEVMGR